MKRTCTNLLVLSFFTVALGFSSAVAQQSQNNSQQTAQNTSEKLEQLQSRLRDLQKDQTKKQTAAEEAIKKAEAISKEVADVSSNLAKSPDDKKLANELKKLERDGKRADRSARKASEELAEIDSKITELTREIEDESSRLTSISGANASSENPALGNQAEELATGASPKQLRADSSAVSQPEMIQKIVEDTYKNYPQQAGQPNIIINNIIIPSEHASARNSEASTSGGLTPDEIAEFRAWRRQAREQHEGNRTYATQYERRQYAPHRDGDSYSYNDERFSFRDRFAELPKRKSGLWVIPMVGLHASNFEMDFDNNEAKGRSGWNAGLDFRAHFNRFFIQPGAHYFSSSLDLTTSDSLSKEPFTSGPRIHSVRVPLLAGVYLTKAQGAFLKFNLKGGIVGNYIIDVDKNDQNFSIDNLERYSYGVNGGFGLEFGFITLDVSHEWGISKFFKNSDTKNNLLRATIGFKL